MASWPSRPIYLGAQADISSTPLQELASCIWTPEQETDAKYTSRSPSQPQRLSLKREGQQLVLPPFSRSLVPSACSRWLFAVLSSAAPALLAQLTASGAVLSVSGVLLCEAEGSLLSAGSRWSVWLEGIMQGKGGGTVREPQWRKMLNFLDCLGKWIPVLFFWFVFDVF